MSVKPARSGGAPPSPPLADALEAALARRAALRDKLAAEETDCLRLFHGAAEGRPGLAVDRYGPLLLAQTWRDPLAADDLAAIEARLARPLGLPLVWNHRGSGGGPIRYADWHDPSLPAAPLGREGGLAYDVRPRHRGQDPLLFLDLRSGRRWLRAQADGASVLNLFAYTCTAGVAAAAGGAREVWNVDFAGGALAIGRENARRNGVPDERFLTLRENALPAMRQLAGLPVGLRRGKQVRYQRLAPRRFDLVLLDPPAWSRSPFGAVDVRRDYPSLFKPALLATEDGGAVLATNHAADVEREDWLEILARCAEKADRPLRGLDTLEVEEDFPSFDGRPPLKIAIARV